MNEEETPIIEPVVPHPDEVVLPSEWNEFVRAAWYERQLDAHNFSKLDK